VESAFRAAARALRARFDPPGDPLHGLPLHPGALAIFRRHLARVAMGSYRRGHLDVDALTRHQGYARRETVLLVEVLASLTAESGPAPDQAARAARRRQVARLSLPGPKTREVRHAMAHPRSAAALGSAAPARVRPFLLEQALLAQLRSNLAPAPAAGWIEAFREAAELDDQTLAAAQVEAAAQHDDHLAWFAAVGGLGGQDWQALADQWEEAADRVVEQVSDAVTGNLDAIATEVRQTGELGTLLAQAASGKTLTADQKRKVKDQLLDLAKAVPALAIFAAPGGLLLLPLLAKLLPFNVLPSAWDRPRQKAPEPPRR